MENIHQHHVIGSTVLFDISVKAVKLVSGWLLSVYRDAGTINHNVLVTNF